MSRRTPEWVPRGGSLSPAQMDRFREKAGQDANVACHFRMDPLGSVGAGPTTLQTDFSKYHAHYPYPMPPDRTRVDEWGVGWVPGSLLHFQDMIHPMAAFTTVEEFKSYPYPDVMAEYRWEGIGERAREQRERGLPVSGSVPGIGGTIYETSWIMRGAENMLADFLIHPDLASYHVGRITEMAVFAAGKLGEAGIDILHTADDVATQRGMMMSPDTWRRWIKPGLAAVIAAARAKKPEMHVWYHSDGDCRAIIPELIEVGVTILNPVQPECFDPVWAKREYGRDLAFWGTIGTQTTMPFGTPEDVRDAVKRMIDLVGDGGGLYVAPTHLIEPDVPWENIEALFEAVCEYGGGACPEEYYG